MAHFIKWMTLCLIKPVLLSFPWPHLCSSCCITLASTLYIPQVPYLLLFACKYLRTLSITFNGPMGKSQQRYSHQVKPTSTRQMRSPFFAVML
ncbi:hypothetical protein L228DRAFT_143727 [Xylona heveae TC161]|uniref:Secreted protein n=1 Tax=Xylona heveae (strain CBS 132557 / TC161) TaxID=1328760 RepID=A0A165GAN3_XYLHT|nr:hypothetical protein L228DRAFT_143727 [Xylona heveae TC161]KZF21954.1 hypothetical protein L228DRAFT_143727 [Xylona heveae TC161]